MELDPREVAAIVAAITSVITTIITKLYLDRRYYDFKLKADFEADQRRKIKEVLGKYKVPLLKSIDDLNHRIRNLSRHHKKGMHNVDGDFENKERHYMHSFVYRFLAVFAWKRVIQDNLIYLDTTIAHTNELELIKFLNLAEGLMTDVKLFKDFTLPNGDRYEAGFATDHFFRNQLETCYSTIIQEGLVISYSAFLENLEAHLNPAEPVYLFIDGMKPSENRLRWYRLHIFHIILMAILNSYGYDYQYIETKDLNIGSPNYMLLKNLKILVEDHRLEQQKELGSLIKAFESGERGKKTVTF